MRILCLDLIAFGPFTNAVLDFSSRCDSPGLHVIYGPNEAGKTSARRALRTALYGFRHQVEFAFLHDKQALRVGATIEDAHGARSSFVRRRGTKNTLLGANSITPLAEDPCAPLLAGIGSVEEFERSFAIGEAELRAGGEAILRGEGALSELLFMTAAGLPRLRAVEREFAARAADLFKPSGKLPPINEAISRLKAFREEQRQKSLKSEDYIALEHSLNAARNERLSLDREIAAANVRKSRLTRFKQALPTAARLKQRQSEYATLADVPSLPNDFAAQRERLHRENSVLAGEIVQLEAAQAATRKQLVALAVRDDVLAAADEIDALKERLVSHRKAARDIELRRNEIETARREATHLVQEVSGDGDLTTIVPLRQTRPDQATIRSLAQKLTQLEDRAEQSRKQANRLRERLGTIEQESESLGAERSAATLQALLKSARTEGDLDARFVKLRTELNELERRFERAIKTLPLFTGDTAALVALPVPDEATIDRFETRFADLESKSERFRCEQGEWEQERQRVETELAVVARAGAVPDETMLIAARETRESGWKLIRKKLDGEKVSTDEPFLDGDDAAVLPDKYEASIQQADDIADRLRREAERVERIARLRGEQDALSSEAARLANVSATINSERERVEHEWQANWSFLHQPALSPREMGKWRERHCAAVELADAAESLRRELAAISERAERHKQALADALNEALPTSVTLASLIERAEETIEELRSLNERRRVIADERAKLASELQEAEDAVSHQSADLQTLRIEWAKWMQRLDLPPTTAGETAQVFLDVLGKTFQKLAEIETLEARIAGMQSDAALFAADARTAASTVEPALTAKPAEDIVEALHRLLSDARSDAAKRQEFTKQDVIQARQLEEKQRGANAAKEQLAQLARLAGTDDVDLLPSIEERAKRKRSLAHEIDELSTDLLKCSGGEALSDFLCELDGIDEDATNAELAQLAERLTELDAAKTTAVEQVARSEQALSVMNGGADAADTAAEAEAVLANLAAHVERYAQLRIAARLLREGRERYRQKSGSEVLEHASQLFSQLTCRAFDGLKVDFGDNDEPTLRGVRAGSGEAVPTDGMSDGTADQLYLALRLAGLHTWLDKHEPMPFIVDDLLIHFDDERAAAALQALADLSKRTQVLFFTHHDHLRRLAEASLPRDVLHVHDLLAARGRGSVNGSESPAANGSATPAVAKAEARPSLF